MNFVRFLLFLPLWCVPAFGISGGFYHDCRTMIALRSTPILITVVEEKAKESRKKLVRIKDVERGNSYLSMETIPFGRLGGTTFNHAGGALRVIADPDGPLFGSEDPDLVQVQDMALAAMWWDIHLSKAYFEWDQEKANWLLKFVIATQYDVARWLLVQSGNEYTSRGVINHLRGLGTIEEMWEAMRNGALPDPFEFRDMLGAWGAIATLSAAASHPEHHDQLVMVGKFFAPGPKAFDVTEVLKNITEVRQSLIAMNLTRFIVQHLDKPKPVYLIMSPRSAEPVANILRVNLESAGVKVVLER